jgi:hypothetical protein
MAQVLTVLLNRLATSHHSSSMGVAWLLGCLVAGWAYTAVRVRPATLSDELDDEGDEEFFLSAASAQRCRHCCMPTEARRVRSGEV